MKKTLTCLLAAATIAAAFAATASDASAQWRVGWRLARRGMEGWRMGTRDCRGGRRRGRDCRRDHRFPPPGYVVYPGYAQPVYGPGCHWASEPLYDGLGRVVGYTGRPVQVCPGYVPPPPPGPGYAGPPPAPPPVPFSFRQNEAWPFEVFFFFFDRSKY